jgi:hypothetical protein
MREISIHDEKLKCPEKDICKKRAGKVIKSFA